MKGEWCYLYRAIDSDGYTLDFQLRKTRDHQAAYAFMKRLMKKHGKIEQQFSKLKDKGQEQPR